MYWIHLILGVVLINLSCMVTGLYFVLPTGSLIFVTTPLAFLWCGIMIAHKNEAGQRQ